MVFPVKHLDSNVNFKLIELFMAEQLKNRHLVNIS